MKKLLCSVVALTSINAFAQKSMITLTGYETGDQTDRSLNFSNTTGGEANTKEQNIALNYAYAIIDAVQLGVSYESHKEKVGGNVAAAGDDYVGYGAKVIYNFAHKLTDTCYASLGFNTRKNKDSDASAADDGSRIDTWTLEYGHRFHLGNLMGMNFNYSPSANLAFAKEDFEATGVNDSSTTNLTLNFVKFDVLF